MQACGLHIKRDLDTGQEMLCKRCAELPENNNECLIKLVVEVSEAKSAGPTKRCTGTIRNCCVRFE